MNQVEMRPIKRSRIRIQAGTYLEYNRQRQLTQDEYVTENHAIMMYEPLLEHGQQQ